MIERILLKGGGTKAAFSLSGITSRDSQREHNYWASNSASLHFHFSKRLSLHGTSGRSREGSGASFSNDSRPGKRHEKFKSGGTEYPQTPFMSLFPVASSSYLPEELQGPRQGSSASREAAAQPARRAGCSCPSERYPPPCSSKYSK